MGEYTVEFLGTGDTIQVSEKETILRACLDAGIAQEYSCRVGMCLACCAEIVEGEVVQPAAHALSDQEKDRYALTCMARPINDLQLIRGNYPPSIDINSSTQDAVAADD